MTSYAECDVFPVNENDEYAIFYNSEKGSCGLTQKTEAEIIDEIRIGRNLAHLPKTGGNAGNEGKVDVIYIYLEDGNDVEKILKEKYHVFMFTETRDIDLEKWKTLAGEQFSILHMPAVKASSSRGGVTILYSSSVLVKNTGRLFTWKHLNTEDGKVFPAVEGAFIDISLSDSDVCTRLAAVFHWYHHNSKGVDCRVNVTNFIGKVCSKEIPPLNNSPTSTHIFGRFNFPGNEEFATKLKSKVERLSIIGGSGSSTFVVTTDAAKLEVNADNNTISGSVSIV